MDEQGYEEVQEMQHIDQKRPIILFEYHKFECEIEKFWLLTVSSTNHKDSILQHRVPTSDGEQHVHGAYSG